MTSRDMFGRPFTLTFLLRHTLVAEPGYKIWQ